MELVEIKNNEQLVQQFKDEENLLETWKSTIKYLMLRELVREALALFGSTYVCESAFTKTKVPEERIPNPIIRQQFEV